MSGAWLPVGISKETDLVALELVAGTLLSSIGVDKLDVPGLEPSDGNGFVNDWLAEPLGGMPARNFSISSLERLPMLESAVGRDLEFDIPDMAAAEVDGWEFTISMLELCFDLALRFGNSRAGFLDFMTSTGGGTFFFFVVDLLFFEVLEESKSWSSFSGFFFLEEGDLSSKNSLFLCSSSDLFRFRSSLSRFLAS